LKSLLFEAKQTKGVAVVLLHNYDVPNKSSLHQLENYLKEIYEKKYLCQTFSAISKNKKFFTHEWAKKNRDFINSRSGFVYAVPNNILGITHHYFYLSVPEIIKIKTNQNLLLCLLVTILLAGAFLLINYKRSYRQTAPKQNSKQ